MAFSLANYETEKEVEMKIKGINYDVGTKYTLKYFSRTNLITKTMQEEIGIIKDKLNCNAVRIYGSRIDRLIRCSRIALENNLEVWISPRFINETQEKTLELVKKCSKEAEKLRKSNSKIIFIIGNELTLDMKGLLAGKTIVERVKIMHGATKRQLKNSNKLLNQFLEKLVSHVRKAFKGKISYASGDWEQVNWNLFDIIGLNRYLPKSEKEKLIKEIRKLKKFSKLIAITEFGSEAYGGVSTKGPGRCDPIDWGKMEIKKDYKRSEKEQADYINFNLKLFEKEGIFATFIYTFVEPFYAYSENPKKDLDIASFNIVKAYADGHIEPKKSFEIISKFYKYH